MRIRGALTRAFQPVVQRAAALPRGPLPDRIAAPRPSLARAGLRARHIFQGVAPPTAPAVKIPFGRQPGVFTRYMRDVIGLGGLAAVPRRIVGYVSIPSSRLARAAAPRRRSGMGGLGEEAPGPSAARVAEELLRQAELQRMQQIVPSGVSMEAIRELSVQSQTGSILD